jgi:hypothetical protein
MQVELAEQFGHEMLSIYQRAKSECDYNASRFLSMLVEHGGLQTAYLLLGSSVVSDGYVALWERKRLDLTVEALVVDERWAALFSEAQLKTASQRLLEYGYTPAP